MKKKVLITSLVIYSLFSSTLITFVPSAYAGRSNVIYPKLKNNGTRWYKPSPSLRSYYSNYFTDMDRSYKQQVIADKRFSASLLNLCGETSALFYRFLKNEAEKPLLNDTVVKSRGSFQKKEGFPFIGTDSQYYKNDMYVEYPRPSSVGKYFGQFVYEYKINAKKNNIYQLDKNLGGGNGERRDVVLLSFLSIYYIDKNGNKGRLANEHPFYLILKIERLKRINKASSEKEAFEKGKNACSWMSTQLK